MEFILGFIAGFIFLQSTLFVLGLKNENLVLYAGTAIVYFPLKAFFHFYRKIRNQIFNSKYTAVMFRKRTPQYEYDYYYDSGNSLCGCTIAVPTKDLEKFYWKCENEYYIEPLFYRYKKDGKHYQKREYPYNQLVTLKYQKKHNQFPYNKTKGATIANFLRLEKED